MDLTYFYDLKENMQEQIVVFDEILKTNINFRESIVHRDWVVVNSNIEKLNELSIRVQAIDNSRVEILVNIAKNLQSKESENFYTLIQQSPIELKDSLISEYYTLKSSITRVQGIYKGLNDYIEHKKEVSKEIIDVLVKDSKGNVYSKPGRREQDSQGFLINRHL